MPACRPWWAAGCKCVKARHRAVHEMQRSPPATRRFPPTDFESTGALADQQQVGVIGHVATRGAPRMNDWSSRRAGVPQGVHVRHDVVAQLAFVSTGGGKIDGRVMSLPEFGSAVGRKCPIPIHVGSPRERPTDVAKSKSCSVRSIFDSSPPMRSVKSTGSRRRRTSFLATQ